MATLYDQFGRPIDMTALREEQAAPEVMGIRRAWGDHPSDGLTPVRLATMLKEAESGDPARYMALAEDIEEKDLHYQAVLGTRKRAVAQLEITVEPADDSAAADADAELIRQFVRREVLQEEIFDLLDAVGKGLSLAEIIWDMSERQWMPVELRWVDPRFIDFDAADRRTPLLKSAAGLKPLDPYKFVRTEIKAKSGLPIRGGIARGASWAYLFKNFDIKGWVQFAEIYGQPLRVGKYGPDATDEDRRKLLRAVANIGTDAAAIIPESMILEFVKADQQASADMYEKLASFMERQQSKAVLGQTTTTDAISGGHAVAKEHNEVREDIRDSDKVQIETVFKRDLVRPIVDLNNGPRQSYPSIRLGVAEEVDRTSFATNVKTLSSAGLPLSKSYIYDQMGMKKPENEDDTLQPMTVGPVSPATATAHASAGDHRPGSPDAIQSFIEDIAAGNEFEDVLTPMIGPLEEMVANSASFEEMTAKLAAILKDMNPEAAAEAIAKARFSARLAGEIDAEIGNGNG